MTNHDYDGTGGEDDKDDNIDDGYVDDIDCHMEELTGQTRKRYCLTSMASSED